MKDINLYEKIVLSDEFFPIKLLSNVNKNQSVLFDNHWHEYLELWYLNQGAANIFCNEHQYHMKNGDLMVANSNELHHGYGDGEVQEYMAIIIDPKFFKTSFSPDGNNYITFENIIWQDCIIKEIFNHIFSELGERKIGFDFVIKSEIYKLLAYLSRNFCCANFTNKQYNFKMKKLDKINKVFDYIQEHYNENVTYIQLANLINVSPGHFCHLFKETSGKSVAQHINSIRIEKACHLLENSTLNVSEIATKVGFNDINYFSRQFKKDMGVSPTKFHTNSN